MATSLQQETLNPETEEVPMSKRHSLSMVVSCPIGTFPLPPTLQGEVPAPITSPGANVEQKALHLKDVLPNEKPRMTSAQVARSSISPEPSSQAAIK